MALCVLLAIPLGVAMGFIYMGYSEELQLAWGEERGTRYQQRLMGVLEALVFEGDLRGPVRELAAATQESRDALLLDDRELERRERRRAAPAEIERMALSGAERGKTLEAIVTLMLHSADTSGLTLDPDLDSYYLADAASISLPRAMALLAQVSDGANWNSNDLTAFATRLDISVARAQEAIDTALREDGRFHGTSPSLHVNLPSKMEAFRRSYGKLTELLRQGEGARAGLRGASQEFARNTAEVWRTTAEELLQLLELRVRAKWWIRGVALSLTALALALALWVAYLVTSRSMNTVAPVIGGLSDCATVIDETSSEIANQTQALAANCEQQAASIETIRQMLDLLLRSAQGTVERVDASVKRTKTAREIAESGDVHMTELAGALAGIQSAALRVSEIAKALQELSFRTNILALNAAVESARAGEAGAGFGVVADEVRVLAVQGAAAAAQSTGILEEIESSTAQCLAKGQNAIAMFRNIAQTTAGIDEAVRTVETTASEQAREMNRIQTSMQEISRGVTANAAGSEEMSGAVWQFREQIVQVRDMAGRLQFLVR